MSLSLILACVWVFAGTFTAMLPMKYQFVPGLTLLLSAPVLLIWIAVDHGPWVAIAGALAVLSMFRRPLAYFWRKAFGSNDSGDPTTPEPPNTSSQAPGS